MFLLTRILNRIRKAASAPVSPEANQAELFPTSSAARTQPVVSPAAALSAERMAAALDVWRQQRDAVQAQGDGEWERTQERLHQRQLAYLRTLHPFLRYYVPLQGTGSAVETDEFSVSGEEKRRLSLRYFIALDYYRNLVKKPEQEAAAYLEKRKAEMSSEDWALVEHYLPDAEQIVKKADAAREHFHRRIPENYRWETLQKAVDSFWAQYGSPDLKYQAAYELARRRQADSLLPAPFRLLGFMGPDWDQGGMVFAIDRNCFADPDPLLCYWEDEMPEIDWTQAQEEPYAPAEDEYKREIYGRFRSLSSGIVPLRIQGRFFFRLDVRAVKASFPHFGEDLPTAELSPYLFARCGSRDFLAHFGQVVDGRIVPLYEKSV